MYSSASGDWVTPQDFFAVVDAEFSFTLDAAATKANAKVKNHLNEKQDALITEWGAGDDRVWLNPPYGRGLGIWIDRVISQVAGTELIVVLLPARTDTAWWRKAAAHADEVRFLAGRIKFDGGKNGAPFPSCLMVFRKHRSGRRKSIRAVLA